MLEPEIPMDTKEPPSQEVADIVKKAFCKILFEYSLETVKSSMEERKGTIILTASIGLFYPKRGKGKEHFSQFMTISLFNVEGNIFISVLARRTTSYLNENSYVDTSVLKGGVPGFSGCVDHTSIISQLIHEAKLNRKDLTVVLIDVANAYGTIPQAL